LNSSEHEDSRMLCCCLLIDNVIKELHPIRLARAVYKLNSSDNMSDK